MQFNEGVYDKLKYVVLIGLPALTAFYLGFANVWNFPDTEQVGTTLGLITTFLGTLLQISNANYKKNEDVAGYIDSSGADEDTGLAHLQLYVRQHPEEILSGKKAVFKVGTPPDSVVEAKPSKKRSGPVEH